MARAVGFLLSLSLFLAPIGAQAADESAERDGRLKSADRMIRIGDVGWAALCALAVTGEVRGHDETWLRVGIVAGFGAVATGMVGKRNKRRIESADRQSVVSLSVPRQGKGLAGVWTVAW